jgi:hypothetical protein
MLRKMIAIAVATAALFATAALARPLIFEKLGENHYAIDHEEEGPRSLKYAYTKASSICTAAGFPFFEVMRRGEEVLEFRCASEAGDGRQEVSTLADPRQVKQARKKLEKMAAKK